jgi:hypothetical protein
VFPEGSRVDPDCINAFTIDDEGPDTVSHVVLNTSNLDDAKNWTRIFLEKNKIDPELVALAYAAISKSELGVYMTPLHAGFPSMVQAYFAPRKQFKQEIVDLI